ncbi:MAG TPA: hypothetical protein VFN26_05350 [Candidatus Acidoferrum sp.]|nr:hypothetical protein [Candidatus Acidoferrum sp.]
MMLWQPLRRNKVDVFLNLCSNWFSIPFKRCELPQAYLILQLRPKLQYFGLAAGVRARHVSCGRHDKRETELIETGTNALEWDGSTMRLDFVAAGHVIVK